MSNDNLIYARAIGTDEPLGNVAGSKIYQCFDPYQGAFIDIVKPFWDGNDGIEHMIQDVRYTSLNWILFYKPANNNIYSTFQWGGSGSSCYIAVNGSNFPAGVWSHLLNSWDFNTVDGSNYSKLFLNMVASTANTTAPGTPAGAITNIPIGRYSGGSIFNGILYPAILNIAPPSYLLFDDFADNVYTSRASGHPGYPAWTVNSGTWSAASGYLEKTASAATWQSIYTVDTNFDDMVWEFTFKLNAATSNNNLTFDLINESDRTGTADGYYFHVHGANPGGAFDLYRIDDAVPTSVINSVFAGDTDEHNVKIVRKSGGKWEIFLDDISKGTGTDNTYTTMSYIVIRSFGINDRIDNIRIYRTADAWARRRLMMVQDLYNFNGSAWDGRPFWVDENGLLIPKRCLDVNDVLASTDLDIVSWPNLMPDNTDYSAARHNMVDDGSMEEASTAAWTAKNSATLAKDTSTVKFGTQSLSVEIDTGQTWGSAYQDITGLSAGDDRWIKTWLNNGSATSARMKVYSGTSGTPEATLLWDSGAKSPDVFDSLEGCFEVAAGHDQLRVELRCDGAATNKAYFDWTYCHKSLVNNGGMEGTYDDESGGGGGTVNVAPDWDSIGVETDGTDTLDKETTIIHSGGASQKIDVDGTDEGITQNFTTVIGKLYTVVFWTFIESGNMYSYIWGASAAVAKLVMKGIGVWQRGSYTFIADSTTSRLRFLSSGGAAKFYIDDASANELDEASPSTNTPATVADSYEVGVV